MMSLSLTSARMCNYISACNVLDCLLGVLLRQLHAWVSDPVECLPDGVAAGGQVCLWYSAVNLVTTGYGALVRSLYSSVMHAPRECNLVEWPACARPVGGLCMVIDLLVSHHPRRRLHATPASCAGVPVLMDVWYKQDVQQCMWLHVRVQ